MADPALRDAVARASYAHTQALWDYEQALTTKTGRAKAEARLAETGRALSAAQSAVVDATQPSPASFTTLLNDPTQQLDPDGVVMASVRTYQNASKATADASDRGTEGGS